MNTVGIVKVNITISHNARFDLRHSISYEIIQSYSNAILRYTL